MALAPKTPKPKISRLTGGGDCEDIEDGDRFSNLPDPIIHHIFSFLETIDITRLSAVSRKWRYLWISMPHLNLDINTVWSRPLTRWPLNTIIDKFKDFVNWVFVSQDGSINLKKCRLFSYHHANDNSVYRWINVVARRNVQELDMSLVSYTPFDLPHCLVTCKSLMSLKLCFSTPCVLKLPASGGFSRLKSLDLLRVELSDYNLLRDFVANSPFLENLFMDACVFREFEMLEIVSANLKNLTLHNSNSALYTG
ncbi:F-box family protein [Melia azedarach]|uniref:F-box family protein n=1 Tax=Melia azedarach TaxID=155640 RepID=A0ACC1YV13_MELAZ|nr:F-box family protein [Melia azedarach]